MIGKTEMSFLDINNRLCVCVFFFFYLNVSHLYLISENVQERETSSLGHLVLVLVLSSTSQRWRGGIGCSRGSGAGGLNTCPPAPPLHRRLSVSSSCHFPGSLEPLDSHCVTVKSFVFFLGGSRNCVGLSLILADVRVAGSSFRE